MQSAELSIIIPSYNEKDNVKPLLEKLSKVLEGINWEVIYVDDDSKDGTYELVKEIGLSDCRVRCLHRIGRRGLSSAAVEGVLSSAAAYVAVMDADLQHDEIILPKMFEYLKNEDLDIVVGSRYVDGGSAEGWDESRSKMSRFATRLARKITRCDLKDPMSGFFMMRRDFFMGIVKRLSQRGYKILLDIFASADQEVKFKEIAYKFRNRNAGNSKLSFKVLFDFGLMLIEKTFFNVRRVG
ncbi:MAG: polyprenol monophosphomannose synthase [Candidatus Omnitrophica bacterium]|nr:polyprenol monophosphomannose synthase [Candidatus Omnitrophota bacterium]